MNKIVILDRDGVINVESPNYIRTPDEWHAISGSLAAIARLNQAGFKVVIATNQSGVARGYYDLAMLGKIHEKLMTELAALGGEVDIFFCPHHPDEHCPCRKPQPGMFYQIQQKYQMQFADVFFIGDSYTDAEVARKVGCRFIMVLTGNGRKALAEHPELNDVLHFENLAKAVEYLIQQE